MHNWDPGLPIPYSVLLHTVDLLSKDPNLLQKVLMTSLYLTDNQHMSGQKRTEFWDIRRRVFRPTLIQLSNSLLYSKHS